MGKKEYTSGGFDHSRDKQDMASQRVNHIIQLRPCNDLTSINDLNGFLMTSKEPYTYTT